MASEARTVPSVVVRMRSLPVDRCVSRPESEKRRAQSYHRTWTAEPGTAELAAGSPRAAARSVGEGLVVSMHDEDRASPAVEPGAFELGAGVGPAHAALGGGGGGGGGGGAGPG